MAARMSSFDWSKTPVGPVEGWPQSLKTTVRIMLTSRYAMWMAWGPALTFFYPEETYHTFSYSPLADDAGAVSGMLCVVTEETERIIGERRLKTLRDLGARTAPAKTADDACRLVIETLGENPADVPVALIYRTGPNGKTARLCDARPLPKGTLACPEIIELTAADADSASAWPLAESMARDEPVLIGDVRERFGALRSGPCNVPAEQAVVLPLRAASHERAAAFLIAGISACRAFDDSYRGFFELVAGQAAAAISNANASLSNKRL